MSHDHRREFLARTLCGAIGAVAGSSLSAYGQGVTPRSPAKPAVVLPPPGIKTFSKMPRNATEVVKAHLDNMLEQNG